MICRGRNIVKSFQILVGLLLTLTLLSPVVGSSPPVEIKLLTCDWASDAAITDPDKIARAFEEYTGGRIKLKVDSYPFESFWEKEIMELSSGSPSYDLVSVDAPTFQGIITAGWVYDLTDWPSKETKSKYGLKDINWNSFSEQAREFLTYEGKRWAVPFMDWWQTLIVRKDLLEKYGLEVPKNWDDFLDVAKKLTLDVDGDGKIDIYGTALYSGMFESCVGADWLTRLVGTVPPTGGLDGFLFDSEGNVIFNRPGAGAKALERIKEVLPYCAPGTLSWSYGEVNVAIREGKVGMVAVFCDMSYEFENPEVSKVAGNLIYTHLPYDSGAKQATIMGTNAYGINKASKHPLEAYEFLEWLSNNEKPYQLYYEVSPITNCYLSIREKYKAKWGKVWKTMGPEIYAVPYHFYCKNTMEIFYTIWEQIGMHLTGKIDAQTAMDAAAKEIARIVKFAL